MHLGKQHAHSTHMSSCGYYTYWLEACFRNSSSVCLKVSKRHLFTVFSTLITSPTEGTKENKLLRREDYPPATVILFLYYDQEQPVLPHL